MTEGYSESLKRKLKGVKVGDQVKVTARGKVLEGFLMPRSQGDPEVLVLKLSNGYNIGVKPEKITKLKSIEAPAPTAPKVKGKPGLKNIIILGAGGTIASKVDYRTGGVKPALTADEIVNFTPGLKELANIKARVLFQMLSENMTPKQWSIIAEEVKKEVIKGADGVVIMHGTDVMGYTAAYLSFALQDLPVPVVIVGAQRSADRGSCDAHINLLCAVKAATSDIAEVTVCMHESVSDYSCVLHQGNRVRKLHSSRRDAFKSIGVKPFARIQYPGLKLDYFRNDYSRADKSRKLKLLNKFDDKVALLKAVPGFKSDFIKLLIDQEYKGLVIEGTGLGHFQMKGYGDKWTKQNEKNFRLLKRFAKKGLVYMTSQTINGRVNMNVYETGRDLLELGVLGNLKDMIPETAYVKMIWALGNSKNIKEAKDLINTNISGEWTERSELL